MVSRVKVYSEAELLESLAYGAQRFSHCISIRNPEETMPAVIRTGFKAVLELKFHDVERAEDLRAGMVQRIPRAADVRGIIQYVRLTQCDATGYVIHCRQGVSRSPAVALGVMYLLGMSVDDAARALVQMRDDAMPNGLILRLFDEALGSRLDQAGYTIRSARLDRWKEELEPPPPEGLLARAAGIRKTPPARAVL
jgi:predicted protein tyrosine phosphatase